MERAMKNLKIVIAVLVVFCWLSTRGDAENLDAPSKISSVTVYPGSAHVTRQVAMDLKAGEQSIVLKDIIPDLDENSLAVAGKGAAKVKIFGAYIKKEFLTQEPNQRVQDLIAKIESLDDQLVVAQGNERVLNQEKEFLNSLNLFAGQQIPKDLVTKMPTTDELGGVLKFLGGSSADIEGKKEELRLKIRALNKEKDALNRQLAEMRNTNQQMQRSIVIDLECLTAGNFVLDVSYLVNGANWRPVYDARARYEQGEVDLSSYGMVTQTTGEDWADVKLTLSTAKPSLGGRMPYVGPWILQPYQPAPQARAGGMMLARKAAMAPAMQYEAFEMKDEAQAIGGAEAEAVIDYAQVEATGIAVEYKIARPAQVKSDGSEYRFPVATQTLQANFEYSTFPRDKLFAYLGSRVVNSPDLQLLAGQVNLFLDGNYVGKSSIDNIGPGEEFDLYLGVDESVKVERKQVSRKMDDVMMAGIPSPNRTTTFQYKLTVENYKSKKIKVILFESMPVSENERIKVKVFGVSMPPFKQDWKDRKGVWRWEFDLDPKAKKEISYNFSVEHPRDMSIPGI
jgi:uncharacterized protein (TIGR02231 family)